MPVKILVADDHEVVRQGVRTILSSRPEWEVCGEVANGQEAVEAAKKLEPDVTILDITMPVMSGLDAAKEIAKLNLDTRVLIFTMHYSSALLQDVRLSGALGYVLKSNAARDLIKAIEALLGGDTFFGSDSTSTGEQSNEKGKGLAFFSLHHLENAPERSDALNSWRRCRTLLLSLITSPAPLLA